MEENSNQSPAMDPEQMNLYYNRFLGNPDIHAPPKYLRMLGKPYISRSNSTVIVRPERKLGPACRSPFCARAQNSRHCFKFTEEERKAIFNQFWTTMNWDERKLYVRNLVEKCKTRSITVASASRRHYTLQYCMMKGEQKLQVCQTMFSQTHGLSRSTVREWMEPEPVSDTGHAPTVVPVDFNPSASEPNRIPPTQSGSSSGPPPQSPEPSSSSTNPVDYFGVTVKEEIGEESGFDSVYVQQHFLETELHLHRTKPISQNSVSTPKSSQNPLAIEPTPKRTPSKRPQNNEPNDTSPNKTSRKSYDCYRCNVKDLSENSLRDHLTISHNVENAKSELDSFIALMNTSVGSNEFHLQCNICQVQFTSIEILQKHIENCHQLCRYCDTKVIQTEEHLQQHQTYCKKSYRCEPCGEIFKFKQSLFNHLKLDHKNHIVQYASIKNYGELDCSYCKFSTVQYDVFMFHNLFHSSRKCTECGQKYIPGTKHIENASDKKCYECEPDSKCPISKLPCLFCKETFEYAEAMTRHINGVHLNCVSCSKQFDSLADIKSHREKSLHNSWLYVCHCCHFVFLTMENLQRHSQKSKSWQWQQYKKVSLKNLEPAKAKSFSQCFYCLKYFNFFEIETHLSEVHNVIRCGCSQFKLKNKNCLACNGNNSN